MSTESQPPPPPPRNHSLSTPPAPFCTDVKADNARGLLVNDPSSEARGLMPFLSSVVALRRGSEAQGRSVGDDDLNSDDDSARTSLPFQPTAVLKSAVSTKTDAARSEEESSSPVAAGLPGRPPKPASEPILQSREIQDDAPKFLAPPPPPRRPSLPAGIDREAHSTPGTPPPSSRRSPSPRPAIATTSATITAPKLSPRPSRALPKTTGKPPLPPPVVAKTYCKDKVGLFSKLSGDKGNKRSAKSQPELAARGQVSSGSSLQAGESRGSGGAGPAAGIKTGSQSQPPETLPPPPPRYPVRDPLPDESRAFLIDVTDSEISQHTLLRTAASETQLAPHNEGNDLTALASQLLANTSRPYALPLPLGQRFQHPLNSGASPLVLANISHSHSYPDFNTGMGLDETSMAAWQLRHQQQQQQALHEAQDQEQANEVRKLLRINLIMRVVFWLLVSLCGALAIAYMVLIGFFFRSLPQGKTCVTKSELRQSVTRWSPHQEKRVYDYLPDRFESTPTQFCFETLDWVPKTMSNIYVDVISTVNEIQEMQQNINESLSSGPSPPSSQANKTSKSAIYAHFLLDVEGSLNGQAELTVLKLKELSTESNNYGVNFTNSNGELKILHNGFYFVYSYVVFKGNNAPKHEIIKMKMSKTEKLQEAQGGPTSTLQGVFRLHKGDSVYVQASRSQLDTSGSKSSYFGLYLVRT